jgi:hypothetical protein
MHNQNTGLPTRTAEGWIEDGFIDKAATLAARGIGGAIALIDRLRNSGAREETAQAIGSIIDFPQRLARAYEETIDPQL